MLRVITALLVLAASTITVAAVDGDTFREMRNELSDANSLPEQRAVIERMRKALQDSAVPGRQVGTMLYDLVNKPVLNEAATIVFLQELIAAPDTAEATTTVITSQFRATTFSTSTIETLAKELRRYHQRHGLSDAAIKHLERTLTKDAPQANREYALSILTLRPLDDEMRLEFLSAVANLLQPEMSPDEKRAAMAILVNAAETGPLPENANNALHDAARVERDPAVRVAAWPFVMQEASKQRESDRPAYNSLGSRLAEQLISPATPAVPSFIDAGTESREQAVALLNDYWRPDYPPSYIDLLIELVDTKSSRTSVEQLQKLRRANALDVHQLRALAKIAPQDPAIREAIRTILIPNLEAGSLMGPIEVIAHLSDPIELARASKQLLAEYPNGTVPKAAAEAAYAVMGYPGSDDAAAVELFLRSDMPFAEREEKILALVDRRPKDVERIIQILLKLHGDVPIEALVRRYVNDDEINQGLRNFLLSMLRAEVKDSGPIDAETAAAILEFGRATDSRWNVSLASGILDASGNDIPFSLRIKQNRYQWRLLGWLGVVALAIGITAGLFTLVLVALPGRKSGLRTGQRALGFVLWLLFSAFFVVAVLLSALHSLGHNSAPPALPAVPYYIAALVTSIFLLVLAIVLRRQRANHPPQEAPRAT